MIDLIVAIIMAFLIMLLYKITVLMFGTKFYIGKSKKGKKIYYSMAQAFMFISYIILCYVILII